MIIHCTETYLIGFEVLFVYEVRTGFNLYMYLKFCSRNHTWDMTNIWQELNLIKSYREEFKLLKLELPR